MKSILIVDDEPAQLSALKRELRGMPYALLTATSGPEALDLLARHDIQVIISDYRMQGMNGVEFLSAARAIKCEAVRVILSGYTDVEAIISTVNRGHIYKFISKPWDSAELLNVVADAFSYYELVRRGEQFNRIFENTAEGVFITGADGLIEAVNPSFTIITSYAPEEVIGSPYGILWAEPLFENDAKTMADMIARAGHWFGEISCRRSNGELFPLEIKLSSISDVNGRVVQIVGMCTDITVRKQVESELERQRHHLEALVVERNDAFAIAKNAADALARARSIFLDLIKDELGTPMNSISGTTQLADRSVIGETVLDHLSRAAQSTQRTLTRVKNLLDMAEIEAKRQLLESIPFSMNDILEMLRELIEPEARAKGLTLDIEFVPALSERLFVGDPICLGQVFLNLAGNAVRFTEQGSVTIRGSLLDEDPPAALLCFEVEDTGIGISAEDQPGLFNSYMKLDGSSVRPLGALGPGLVLSKQLVELMGGTVTMTSQPGKGTIFRFTVRVIRSSGGPSNPKVEVNHEKNPDR